MKNPIRYMVDAGADITRLPVRVRVDDHGTLGLGEYLGLALLGVGVEILFALLDVVDFFDRPLGWVKKRASAVVNYVRIKVIK